MGCCQQPLLWWDDSQIALKIWWAQRENQQVLCFHQFLGSYIIFFFFLLFNAKWREQTPTTVFFPLRLSLLHVVHHSGEKPKHKIEQLIEVASRAWNVLSTAESILCVWWDFYPYKNFRNRYYSPTWQIQKQRLTKAKWVAQGHILPAWFQPRSAWCLTLLPAQGAGYTTYIAGLSS